jgi:hypothetical protein
MLLLLRMAVVLSHEEEELCGLINKRGSAAFEVCLSYMYCIKLLVCKVRVVPMQQERASPSELRRSLVFVLLYVWWPMFARVTARHARHTIHKWKMAFVHLQQLYCDCHFRLAEVPSSVLKPQHSAAIACTSPAIRCVTS